MKRKITPLLVLFLFASGIFAQENLSYNFHRKSSAKAAITVTDNTRFTNDREYGFDFNNLENVKIYYHRKTKTGYCTSDVPFYFSILLPEGNYRITATIGNPRDESVTTIKAEARRLMLGNCKLEKGESKTFSFNVSVRSPLIHGNDSIRLKPREINYMNWDNRLTLEFSGNNQAVQHISITPLEKATTLFLAGNSTVTDQDHEPWASWGQMITPYFDSSIVVANYAESGEALASFKSSGRLIKILTQIKPGDFLFIEFGHNDQKRKGDGIGPWTSFSDLLREYAISARARGAIPVFVTPTQRRSFNEKGVIVPTHGDYPAAMRKVAREMNVPLIDLNYMTRILYEAWGFEESKKAFVHYPANTFPGQTKKLEDNTHFNVFGAHEIALCLLKGIVENEIELRKNIINFDRSYDPGNPNSASDWKVPPSPRYISTKPEGN